MANSAAETLIGGVVVVAAAGFVLYAGQTTGFSPDAGDRYTLTASFQSAEGITPGTDVRMAGVKIGSVIDLDLDRESYQAVVELSLQDDIKIPDDSDVKVASEGLLGGNFIEISPGGSEFMLTEGDEILYTQGAVSFLSLLLKFVSEGASES